MRFLGVNPGEHPQYIIVGLGNPGQRYENTRHNIGFDAVDYIDANCVAGRGCKRMLHSALCDKCVLDGYVVYIIKPQTFMNNSGMAVADVMKYYRMSVDQLIVVHDDTSVAVGEFKVKKGGSASGHNGLRSIIQHIGSNDFIRIRIGVGAKPEEWEMSKYVLSKIPPDEYKKISSRFDWVMKSISEIMNYGIEKALKPLNNIGTNKYRP